MLVDDRSPLRQDAACARKAILSDAIATTGPAVNDEISGGVQVFVTDTRDFENLFAYVLTNVPADPEVRIRPIPNGGGNGGDHGNVEPTTPPPPQPVPVKAAEPKRCERSAKICISTKDQKISTEFKVKCANMPEFTFSTEGEASMKLGPISVSLAAD